MDDLGKVLAGVSIFAKAHAGHAPPQQRLHIQLQLQRRIAVCLGILIA